MRVHYSTIAIFFVMLMPTFGIVCGSVQNDIEMLTTQPTNGMRYDSLSTVHIVSPVTFPIQNVDFFYDSFGPIPLTLVESTTMLKYEKTGLTFTKGTHTFKFILWDGDGKMLDEVVGTFYIDVSPPPNGNGDNDNFLVIFLVVVFITLAIFLFARARILF